MSTTAEPPLLIRALTPTGTFLPAIVDIEIHHRTMEERMVHPRADASRDIQIWGLQRKGEYAVTVSPRPGNVFRPQRQFVTIPAEGAVTITFTFREQPVARMGAGLLGSPPWCSPPWTSPPGIPPPDEEPLPARYFVSGTVVGADGAFLGGMRLIVVDKNVGGDVVLKNVLTNAAGRYSAEFDASDIRQRGKKKPDLQVRVCFGAKLLAVSDIRYNAGEREVLDVRIPAANAGALPSEYETLLAAIRSHYAQPLSGLQETDTRQDVTYLANKTGWDARAVALAALSDRFSNAHGGPDGRPMIPAAIYYALFRAGLPADPTALYKTDVGTVERVVRQSMADNIIPRSLEIQLPGYLDWYRTISAEARLTAAPGIGVSSLGEMLDVADLGESEKARFSAILTRHGDDAASVWTDARKELGPVADRLELDGKLAFMTLNNAPLMQVLHEMPGGASLSDPAQLAGRGLHRASDWQSLIETAESVPGEIPGETIEEKQHNYSQYLAAQVRLSYPTLSIAETISESSRDASEFLVQHHNDFVIGAQPIEQYIARNNLTVNPEVVDGIKRVQRLYQITPNDQAFDALIQTDNIHSAFDIVRQPRDVFIARYAADLGGTAVAETTYDRAFAIHNDVLNVVVAYGHARNGFELGFGEVLQPAPQSPTGANADDLVAYPTLEKLFGSMDYCACEHCRSVLSPAAYLVDLLQFIDRDPKDAAKENPQKVLFDRRPDIQHLPLTCENTNTAMPYIDVVNETLEYFIANQVQPLSLRDYLGHDTNGSASDDLLAAPQFIMDGAYTTLQDAIFPPPLPFHRSLELLRASLEALEMSLPLAMERLRKNDNLVGTPYGWRAILLEESRISPKEHELLTSSTTVSLAALYGFAAGTDVIAALSNAKTFTRRVGISYEELVALLRTRFVNPASDLIPRLDRLGVKVPVIVDFKNNVANVARFDASLPSGGATIDPIEFGGDVHQWATDQQNFDRLMTLIVLSTRSPEDDLCNFGVLELRYAKPAANPADVSNRINAAAFLRLIRFIRLWRKIGWTMEQTDAALCALSNPDGRQLSDADIDTAGEIDSRLRTFLLRLAVVRRVMNALELTPERDLLPLLACWSDIGTFGEASLYRQLFLNPAILAQDPIFAADRRGEYLKSIQPPNDPSLAAHAEAVRAALNLTGADYDEIVTALGFNSATKLTLPNVSAIFRRGYLARKLRISVHELHALMAATGLNPFAMPDFTAGPSGKPAILQLIELVQALKDHGLKIADALYLIWNKDLSGKSAPDADEIRELARALQRDFAEIGVEAPARKRQQALQRLSAAAKTDLALTMLLLDAAAAPYPLHAHLKPAQPALDDVLRLGTTGLNVTVHYGTGSTVKLPDPATNLDYSQTVHPLPVNPLPNMPYGAEWHGRFEAPESGTYHFIVETDGTAATLDLDGARSLSSQGNVWRNDDVIVLEAGAQYDFSLRVDGLQTFVKMQWETPTRPAEVMPARHFRPDGLIEPFVSTYERFLKVAALAQALRLTGDELAYLGKAVEYQLNGSGWLNQIPVGTDTPANGAHLYPALRSALEFTRIKKEVGAKDQQVLDALQNPAKAASIMHWDGVSFNALVSYFAVNPAHVSGFARIYDAFSVARAVGISTAALTAAVGNAPTAQIVRDFQGALRARYAAEDWRTLVQPINDRMRGLQRNALVAYILHQFRGDPATEHIDTPERLFEYFLMDVQMEPCMQTSRIRHALSSVQLFIERCLMNLERDVEFGAINAEQWEWMKRYRMWEANRKVFLFPENWLEPELRDDKSPFFREIESELLQSDITEDSARTAVLNYLARLEEVAKLEPCGIFHETDVDHVIARTAGTKRKYLYRRREGVVWTPWEPIKADIEDNPVLPVVWNGRVLLFWLRLTSGSPKNEQRATLPGGKLGTLTDAERPKDPGVVTNAVLCWSEYYNGKWQAAKTSDPDDPVEIPFPKVPRGNVGLRSSAGDEGEPLLIHIEVYGAGVAAFALYNTHSLPLRQSAHALPVHRTRAIIDPRWLMATSGRDGSLPVTLAAQYYGMGTSSVVVAVGGGRRVARTILSSPGFSEVVETRHARPAWEDPFLYANAEHVFYVTSHETFVPVWQQLPYGFISGARIADNFVFSPAVAREPVLTIPPRPEWPETGPNTGASDPLTITHFLSEDAYIRHGLTTPGTITFGDREIGPAGSILRNGGL